MTDAETTVFNVIHDYPMLFSTRTDVLHFLFAVVGNGYEWVGGELVEQFPEGEKTDLDRNLEWALYAFADRAYDMRTECLSIRQLAQIRAHQRTSVITGPYARAGKVVRRSESCALLTMPDDVHDDWRALAEEIRPLVEAGWEAEMIARSAG